MTFLFLWIGGLFNTADHSNAREGSDEYNSSYTIFASCSFKIGKDDESTSVEDTSVEDKSGDTYDGASGDTYDGASGDTYDGAFGHDWMISISDSRRGSEGLYKIIEET